MRRHGVLGTYINYVWPSTGYQTDDADLVHAVAD